MLLLESSIDAYPRLGWLEWTVARIRGGGWAWATDCMVVAGYTPGYWAAAPLLPALLLDCWG